MSVPEDETALVGRAAAGDAQAFAQLVGPCRNRAWAVCYRITGNRGDAEDALQDALISAWRSLPSFRGGSLFSTWLHRIAHNAALAVVKRRRDVPVEEIFESADPVASFASGVEDRDAIGWALARIPEDFRTALVLREWADMTYADIAETQGINIQTVKSRINRARRALHDLLVES